MNRANRGLEKELLLRREYIPFLRPQEISAIHLCFNKIQQPINVLEWGSGKSTIYFSSYLQPASQWYSIEHDHEWYEKVKSWITTLDLTSIHLFHVPNNKPFPPLDDGDYDTFKEYVEFPKSFNQAFDFILVDGRARVDCLKMGWSVLKQDGFLVLHDAQRAEYQPGVSPHVPQLYVVSGKQDDKDYSAILFMNRNPDLLTQLTSKINAHVQCQIFTNFLNEIPVDFDGF